MPRRIFAEFCRKYYAFGAAAEPHCTTMPRVPKVPRLPKVRYADGELERDRWRR